jgi:hypothetical protein
MRSSSKRSFGAYLPTGIIRTEGRPWDRRPWRDGLGRSRRRERHRDGCKCERVAGANAVEQAGYQTRKAKRRESSNG